MNKYFLAAVSAVSLLAVGSVAQAATFTFEIGTEADGLTGGDVQWSADTGASGDIVDHAGTWYPFTNINNTYGYANLRTDNYVGGAATSIGMGLPNESGTPYVLFQAANGTPLFSVDATDGNGRPVAASFTPGTYSVDYTIGGTSYTDVPFVITGSGSLSVGTGPGAPEPASWALMLAGFAGLGGVLRARRGAALAA
jgi:hypothetical protein